VIKAWSDDAWQDFEYWTRQDKKTLKRIMALLRDIDRNGNKGISILWYRSSRNSGSSFK